MSRLLFLALFACTPTTVNQRVLKAAPGRPRIVVLESSAGVYHQPVQGFVDAIDGEVTGITLDADSDEAARAALLALTPALVFSLGNRATMLAAQTLPHTPVVSAMVADYRSLQAFPNVTGIAFEALPLQEFSQFKMVLPALKRVLVLHSRALLPQIDEARRDLRALGIELVAVEIRTTEQIDAVVRAREGQVDAVWLPSDPLIMTAAGFADLRRAARDAKVPLLASLSDYFAKQGAYAAVSVDFTSLGAQAAARARAAIAGQAVGFEAPIGAALVVNTAVAKQLALEVPEDLLPFLRTVTGD